MSRSLWLALKGRLGFASLVVFYGAVVGICLVSLIHAGDLSWGRNPWSNLVKSVGEFSHPSFLDVWFGNERLEYRSSDGSLLRVENRRQVEARDHHAGARCRAGAGTLATGARERSGGRRFQPGAEKTAGGLAHRSRPHQHGRERAEKTSGLMGLRRIQSLGQTRVSFPPIVFAFS